MNKQLKKLLLLICIFSTHAIVAQTTTITGTITDASDGMPLPGVNVIEKNTSNGVITDFDGNYSLEVSNGNAILQFSFLGYEDKEVAINGQTVINATLEEGSEALDEVVITALGISRDKKSLGYAVTQLDGSSVSLAKETNIASSLAGKVAGVVVSKSTSGPGGGTRIVIRGNGSISGNNQPLYVVDGVPVDNSSRVEQGPEQYNVQDLGTGISDINPDDIESMSILKGPNAAALYGSRASNGVIIITTKKGSLNQGLGITFNTSSTFDSPLVLPQYQNQYGRGVNGNFTDLPGPDLFNDVQAVKGNNSWGPAFDGSSQLEFNGENRTYSAQPNNVKDFFETGTSFVNTLAISNSTENASVRFSYTNSDIQSILPNSGLDRHNFNLRAFTKLSDKLSFDGKVTYFLQDAKNRPTQGNEGIIADLYNLPRNVSISDVKVFQDINSPIHNHDAADETSPYDVIAPLVGNPFWHVLQNSNEDNRSRISGFAKLDYQLNDWLSAFIRVGHDAISHDTKSIIPQGYHFFRDGRINFNQRNVTETNYDFLVTFNKDLNEKFNLSASIGGNARHTTLINSGSTGAGFKIPGKYFLDNTDGTRITASQSDLIEKKVNSLYGQASISYNDMIYLDITGRNDWSSALAAENRSYFYSSQSLSFLVHKIFEFGNSPIGFLKLRASSANVGNDTDSQQIVNLFSVAGDGYLGVTQVTREVNGRKIKFSESLKPEDIRSTEFGLEFKLLKNRIYGDFSIYDITTKDLIFDVPVDPATGFDNFRENVGELSNKGFELLLGGTPIVTDNFSWDISANISKNENKLVSLIEGQDFFEFTSSDANSGIVDVRGQVGDGYGDIYATTWKRNDAGQLLLTDDGRPQATESREKFGNYQPDYTGGITNTFNYKSWTLNFLIDFRIGGEIFSYTDAQLDAAGVTERSLQYREGGVVVEGVYDEGVTVNTPGAPNTENISAQEYWGAVSGIGSEYIYDQTNARLRELSLTYRFPKSILEKSFIQNASLSLTGRNLFFLSKKIDNFDPESSYSTSNFSQGVLSYALPTTKSFGLSLNVNF